MIEVSINGETRSVNEGLKLSQLLEELGVAEHILLVEMNGDMIRREHFDENAVEEGDILELIRITGGG
ncbi:MAG: sulfur carrier protein ThiS [Deltaproteobacteria bacterium]|nr:sulfur carrier protein ThiS [Deltaproteobacteria bacterium]